MSDFQAEHVRAEALRLAQQRAALKAQELRNEVVQLLSQPGTGRRYTRGNRTHTASAPGNAPAVDSGRLRQSIGVQQVAEGHYRVGTNVEYAPYLEYGTRRMAARPFLRPAFEKVKRR